MFDGKRTFVLAVFLVCLGIARIRARKYLGCFKDAGVRAMSGFEQYPYTALTIDICIRKCASLNFKYAGLQAGYACFCDNTFDRYGKASEKTCNTKCNGKHTETCGGGWRNAVYATGIIQKQWGYIGCFKDNPKRAMIGYVKLSDKNLSTDKCVNKCRSLKFKFAGTQYASACFCGNSYARYGKDHHVACSMKCSGKPFETCGGPWRNSVFSTGIKPPKRKYIGCYKDAASRAMSGFQKYPYTSLTIDMCINKCASLNFEFAGVQAGYACFCDNTYDKYGKASEKACNTKCYGIHTEICGGGWRNSVYATGIRARKYIGCFKDAGVRAMSGFEQYPYKALTIDICIKKCASLNFKYAGLQAGYACFCDNSYNKYGEASKKTCNTKCNGRHTETCGGGWRNAVYATGIIQKQWSYIGCFKDNSKRAMIGYAKLNDKNLSTDKCVNKCRSLKFKFAGTQYASACFCGNSYARYGKDNHVACSMKCSGKPFETCGGPWRNSVFSTGIKPPKRKYIGCYKDAASRAMSGFQQYPYTSLTIDMCINKCASLNFKYAGVQAGYACFCDNTFNKYGRASEKTCNTKCYGIHTETCGGGWKNSVYATGIVQKQWSYIGCFKDKPKRAMIGYIKLNDKNLSTDKCVNKCRSLKFRFAGTQYASACFCGNSYARYGKDSHKACSMKCSGKPFETCGGPWRNSVFSTGIKPPKRKYIGCYKDAAVRAMSGFERYPYTSLTLDMCINKCASLNFKYAGVQAGYACFCDNTYDKYGKASEKTCNTKCYGIHTETCGGGWRNSVYATGIIQKQWNYIGCFKDKPKRAMIGYAKLNDKNLSTDKCVNKCRSLKFKFAGTQYASACFCGNSYARYGKDSNKACSMKCSGGEPFETCGGPWRNSVFSTGIKSPKRKYIGCYKDTAVRAMSGFKQYPYTSLTLDMCINKCASLNFKYAGAQAGYACFCDNTYNKYGKASETACNTKCNGMHTETCGGGWRNSVYATGITQKQWNYIGCFKDNPKRAMIGYKKLNDKNLSTDKCVNKCRSLKFRFAGTQYASACFCGNSYARYGKDSHKACSMKCSGKPFETCGGPWRNSVFSTGIKPPKRKYIGCYKDAAVRAMSGFQRYPYTSLTIDMCINKCASLNFKYAGVQAGYACFCDNTYDKYGQASEKTCNTKCYGIHTEICGGGWRNSVYATEIGLRPVVVIVTKGKSFEIVTTFPANQKPDDVMYAITWYFGGSKITRKVGQETTNTLTPEDLTGLRIGQTIYAELVVCRKHKCATERKRYKSNVIRIDFGIPDTLTLTEGHPAVDVKLTSQIPPSFWCKNCRITIRAYFSPLKELKCFDTNVYQACIARTDIPCGVVITQDNWQPEKEKVLPIKATEDGLVDGKRKRHLKFYARLESEGKQISSMLVKTVEVTVNDFKVSTSAVCFSLNDPHMKTFDGLGYENFRRGTFILYRHTTLPQEIQTYYRSCNGVASCNCAVSVRARDDVILIDSCGEKEGAGKRPLKIKAFVNGEMTPGLEIRRFTSGKEFRIFLPTGTYVIVKVVSYGFNAGTTFLNVWVKASSLDYGHTQGLCGTFDSNRNNDLMLRSGHIERITRHPNKFSDNWRPTEEEKIYNGYCPKPGETFADDDNREYCDCTAGQRASCGLNKQVFKCKAKQQTFAQKKRQGEDITDTLVIEPPEGCKVGEEKTDFEFEDVDAKEPTCPTNSGITDVNAEKFCKNAVRQSPSGRSCKKVQEDMFDKMIKNCRRDLCMTDDKHWVVSLLSDLKTECQIKEQTIVDNWKPNKDGDLIPDPAVDGITCPRDCSFHGKCKGGICQCDDGYMDDDCSLSTKQPPFVNGFQDGVFCDKKCKACRQVTLFGNGFVEGRGLTCHITEQENGKTVESYSVPAKFINFQTVSCKLRKATSCKVRVSNRNNIASDAIAYTVFDSSCETCSEKGRFPRNDVCTIARRCYKAGSLSLNDKTLMCFPKLNTRGWTDVMIGKKNVVATALRFNKVTGKTLQTSVGKFEVSGSPRIINTKRVGRVLQLSSKKDYVTIPSSNIFECPIKVAKCSGGFTLEFFVRIPKLCDNMVIVSSGGELLDFSGIGIFYKQGRLVATVDTPTKKWTVSAKVPNLNTFTKLSLSWSMSSGLVFTVNDETVRKAGFCDAKQRRKKHKPSNIMRMGRSINGKSACPGQLQIGGFNLFPAEKEVVDKIGLTIVDGGWSDWSQWTGCSRRCGGGSRTQTRSCTNPRPSRGARGCVGQDLRKEQCNTEACAVPVVKGRWKSWAEWSDCSGKCGVGIQQRVRECSYPVPCGGKRIKCVGDVAQARLCKKPKCVKKLRCLELECKGEDGHSNLCNLPNQQTPKRIQVIENYGKINCIVGNNFGVEEDMLWVDAECNGRFKVCYED